MTLRLAVLASGRGSNMLALLDAIDAGLVDATVGLVVSDRPGAPCVQLAQARGVPAVLELPPRPRETRAEYDARLEAAIAAEAPDLVVLTGFMRILGAAFCEAFAGKIINIHPALLPSFKGAHGIRDTLASGARLAGCTTHFVTAALDGGPILLQAAVQVHADDDEASLARRVLALEHHILPRTVQLLAEDRIRIEADGRAAITPGPSWKERVEVVADALYGQGF